MPGNSFVGALVRRALGIRIGVLHQGGSPSNLPQLPNTGRARASDDLPRISVVTPSFNQCAYVGRTVQSVLNQEYRNLEYIVQDNFSDDGTREVLESVKSSCFRYYVERDAGQADAINKGFSRCTGDIMGYLNSDDVLLPGALTRIARVFVEHPRVEAVYGNRVLLDGSDNVVGRWVLPYHDGELLRRVDYVPQETLFWRRSLWERCGGCVDEKLNFALDWDLLLRFVEADAVFHHVPEYIGGFRVHEDQKTHAKYLSDGVREIRRLRRLYSAGLFSKLTMPLRHLVFLIAHVYVDRRSRV